MERLNRFIWFCLIVFLIDIFCLQNAQATPPGKSINKLEEKELTATLYITGIAVKSSRLTGVEFIWIPSLVEKQCMGKSGKDCWLLSKEFARSNKNNLFRKYRYPRTRALSSWVAKEDKYPESKKILEEILKLNFIKELIKSEDGERYFEIDKQKRVEARIHWELWPNGENFRVLEVIGK